jgi:hypothetical protein
MPVRGYATGALLTKIADLPAITEAEALAIQPGTLIWLKWDSPGACNVSYRTVLRRHVAVCGALFSANYTKTPKRARTLTGLDGHNEWWSATVRKPLYGTAGAVAAATGGKASGPEPTGLPKRGGGGNKWKTSKKSKMARAWQGWYRLDFTSFICNDGFDLRDAAIKDRLRMGDKSKTL